MDNYNRSPRKLQKRSTSTSPYPRDPRHSLENVSISDSALSFGETRTLTDETDTRDRTSRDKSRPSSHSDQHLLSPPAPDPELAHSRPSSHFHSHRDLLRWTTEILVLISGAVCLTSITLILWRADGNPPPQWPLNTNLNTMIAFLASLAKVTFVMAIVECLGQLKWIWFLSANQSRPLIDFQLFEEATKGGWSSWKLLLHFKGWLPSFGALILVSGLLTSTFTQMAVTYPVLQAEAKNGSEVATVERATAFSVYDGANLVPGPFEAVREQQAVYTGGFFPPNEEAPHLPPVCSSGDCVWPVYGSLAVCSSVVNLTAQANNLSLLSNLRNVTAKRLAILYASIKSNGDIYNWTNFQSQALPGFYPVILGPMFSPSTSFNASVQNLILNDNFIAYPTRMLDPASALDLDAFHFLGLTFWWCTKSYSTIVKAGQHTTVELDTRYEIVPPPPSNPAEQQDPKTKTLNMAWSHDFYPCYTSATCNATFGDLSVSLLPPSSNLSQPQPATYDINIWTALTVSGLLAATMWDSVLMDQSHGVVTSNGGGVAKAFALSVLGDFLAPTPNPVTQMSSAQRVAGNIARSITNLVRKEAGNFTLGGGEAVVQGTVYTPQARVEVHWAWICVLSVQLVATGVFLGLTVWTSRGRRMEVFKGSSLASLVALDGETRRELGGLGGWEGLEGRARRMRVRLEKDGEGGIVGLGVVRAQQGGEGKVMDEEEENEGEGEGEGIVDTRRQGMVFDDYDTVYLGRTDTRTDGGNSLRRLMTDD